jgi:CheY-like chemotaxis protein
LVLDSDRVILIVEDNRTNALILRTMLQKSGYKAAVATDGAEGVEMADQLKPPLVLLDLHMPRLDGFAAAAEMRRRAGCHPPAIIAVTANVSPEVHAACLASGFAAVLSKPVFLDALVATVRRFAPPAAGNATTG